MSEIEQAVRNSLGQWRRTSEELPPDDITVLGWYSKGAFADLVFYKYKQWWEDFDDAPPPDWWAFIVGPPLEVNV